MSRKSWSRGLLDILRTLGVAIDKETEVRVLEEREADSAATTADVVARLAIAPPEVLEKAVAIAKAEGSTELLQDQFSKAQQAARDTRQAYSDLASIADAIARK